jgi:hypothetical protein
MCALVRSRAHSLAQETGAGRARPTSRHATRCWLVLSGRFLSYVVVDEPGKAKAGTGVAGAAGADVPAKPTDVFALQFCSLKVHVVCVCVRRDVCAAQRVEGTLAAARPKAERARLPHCALLITPVTKCVRMRCVSSLTRQRVRFVLASDDARELAEWRVALQRAIELALNRVVRRSSA